jgi:hypothetical protein
LALFGGFIDTAYVKRALSGADPYRPPSISKIQRSDGIEVFVSNTKSSLRLPILL